MLRKLRLLGFCVLLAFCLVGCSASQAPAITPVPTEASTEAPVPTAVPVPEVTPDPATLPTFVIQMKDGATMRGVLYPNEAPLTVAHFIEQANAGLWDGVTLRALFSGTMLQMNAPAEAKLQSIEPLIGEFLINGYRNRVEHTRGTLSMQRGAELDSAVAQFYILVKEAPGLNGNYAAFGRITEGLETLDAMKQLSRDDKGIFQDPPCIESVRVDAKGSPDKRAMIQKEDMNTMQYPTFTLEMENGGQMTGELYPDTAPQSVANFIELANSGFYDGL
ncbi:MAG: peptidylprolyl isomerase, partial [Clostridia bacterium]